MPNHAEINATISAQPVLTNDDIERSLAKAWEQYGNVCEEIAAITGERTVHTIKTVKPPPLLTGPMRHILQFITTTATLIAVDSNDVLASKHKYVDPTPTVRHLHL